MKALINGIHLGYQIIGNNGPPLVLIHGFGMNRTIWMEMVRQYMGEQLVILPDLRGHGESEAPDGTYSMSLMARDISELLDQLGFKQAAVCGHSMGGYVSLAFAEQYPEKLIGLGLITSRSKADTDEKIANRLALAAEVKEQGTFVMAKSLAPRLSRDPRVVEQAYQILMGTEPRGVIGASLGMAKRPDRSAVLKQISRPVLVVAGEEDQIIPIEEARDMGRQLQYGEFLSLHGTGHLPMMETPELLSHGLLDLIKNVKNHQLHDGSDS